MENKDLKPVLIGNIYGDKFGTGYAGNVWDAEFLCPTLGTMMGGNRQPMVIVYENRDKKRNKERLD